MSRGPFGRTGVWDAVAALRCWEHEDCLEHPELALACADGASTPVGVAGSGACDNLTTHETIYGGNGDTSSDGDGLGNMWGSWSGEGNGHGLPGTYDAGVLESEGDGGSPRDPERGVRVGGGSDDSWIALDFVEPYYTNFPTEAERFIAYGRLHRSGW